MSEWSTKKSKSEIGRNKKHNKRKIPLFSSKFEKKLSVL